MSHTVVILPENVQFQVETDQSVLDAALAQGINLAYGCQKGFCGSCEAKVVEGRVHYENQPPKLSDADIQQGRAFLCSCFADSDLKIEAEIIKDTAEIEVRILPCKVSQMDKVSSDVMVLRLKLADGESLQFLPGQYIDILLADGRKRSFSIAHKPHNENYIDLHIRHVPGGVFTDHVFSDMQPNELLRFEGPHGSFFYRNNNKPLILMAGGTGFAPIKAIMEQLLAEQFSQAVYLYWGARTQADLYMNELAEQWSQEHDNVHYIPVLSQADDNAWQGRRGYVHEAILEDFESLSKFDIYACGPPAMITAAESAFLDKGMNKDAYFYDSFEYAAESESQTKE